MAEPKNQMLKLAEHFSLPEQLTRNMTVPDLDEESLHALTLTCKHYLNQYKDKHADKKVAADMLHCVLNPTLPNQARFLKLLSEPKQDKNGQPLYLIRNHGEEVYLNKAGMKKTKTKRYSTNVLEAILRTKNFHLAKTLFNCIPENAKTENLKQYISVIKSKEIWGMTELQLAYKNFLDPCQALVDAKKWDELNRLSGRIGQAQKEHLPWFLIYLFCHPNIHSDADYTKVPNWTCLLWDGTPLDLDLFGPASIYALYIGGWCAQVCAARFIGEPRAASLDLSAFSSQCKVLLSEMDKTIKLYDLDEAKLDSATKPAFGQYGYSSDSLTQALSHELTILMLLHRYSNLNVQIRIENWDNKVKNLNDLENLVWSF